MGKTAARIIALLFALVFILLLFAQACWGL